MIGRIVMQETIHVADRFFLRDHQYPFEDMIRKNIDCDPMPAKGSVPTLHFRLRIDGRDYFIPTHACVRYDIPIPEEWQDRRKFAEQEFVDRSNWEAVHERLSGMKVDNTYHPDVDLRAWNEIKDDIKERCKE